MPWAGPGPKPGSLRHGRTRAVDRRRAKSEAIVPVSKKNEGEPALWRAQNRNWEQEVLLVLPSFGSKWRGEWSPKFDMWEVYAPLIHRPSRYLNSESG